MSSDEEQLTSADYPHFPQSWSPDGKVLAFVETHPTTNWDIWLLSLDERGKPLPLLQSPSWESGAAFSPDGRWLAYAFYGSVRSIGEIYVQPYPGPGGKRQVAEAGDEPVWAPNGRELFYREGDKMMAVEIATDPVFTVGKATVLFEGAYDKLPITSNYDITPDGQRFLMIKPSEREPLATQLHVVQEWFEELKSRLPSGKN